MYNYTFRLNYFFNIKTDKNIDNSVYFRIERKKEVSIINILIIYILLQNEKIINYITIVKDPNLANFKIFYDFNGKNYYLRNTTITSIYDGILCRLNKLVLIIDKINYIKIGYYILLIFRAIDRKSTQLYSKIEESFY